VWWEQRWRNCTQGSLAAMVGDAGVTLEEGGGFTLTLSRETDTSDKLYALE